ncbi:hypothetical protein DL762_002548 [Monosporascus cannonballus]|uniref:Major facilitator superfamily (MFS) profile domain-containing protein n=1 Tax=Monosporascus cannonballus TaxID=155416 RepID=A0ABY0HHK7_9PEZI|nr:hypothetical protein DL762_002548 [Monosporascus cannonballus]
MSLTKAEPHAGVTRSQSRTSQSGSTRAPRTGSQIYQRYSLPSVPGASTEELDPTRTLENQHTDRPGDSPEAAGAAAPEGHSNLADGEIRTQATLSIPKPAGGRAIVHQFNNLADLPWVSVGFILGGTATALPLTGLYGALDAKWLYIAVSYAISVFSEPAKTPIYIGYIGLSWGAGTVFGPIIGGAFAFYINLVIGAVSTPVLLVFAPNFRPRPLDVPAVKALQNIDWLGAALSVPAFVLGIMAISFGGTEFPWNAPFIVSSFWAAGVLFFLFWLQQHLLFKTTRATRLFPIHFFAKKNMFLLFIIQASVGGIVVIPLYLMALYYPFAQNDTALQAGVKLLPLVAFLVVAIVFNGHAMGIWGYHQVWIVVGSVMVLVSGVFFSRLTVDTPNATIYGLQVVLGMGTGAFSQAGFAIAQAMADANEIQNAISFMLIAQLAGTSLGLSISGAIFQNLSVPQVQNLLGPAFSPDQVVRIVTRVDETLIASLPDDLFKQAQDIVIGAITQGHVGNTDFR